MQLLSKVKSVFWSPFCNGLAVVYESLTENLLRFSKNRLDTNMKTDYSILAQTKYSFKLSFDEKLFQLLWTSHPTEPKCGLSTN